jgi:hypothetical protein
MAVSPRRRGASGTASGHRPTIDRVIPCRVASPQSPTPFHPAADRNDHAKEVQEQDHRSGTVKDDHLTCECLNKLGGPQLRAEMGPFCAPITSLGLVDLGIVSE